ncbi:M56 family metallopeptidase [uncultured Subdoligranulum sp.]|uniref:M56 family metallopeptidase n=1 Tax=uncultured Subdoligranulum sp. TaxID=512298 RepID=UPI0025E6E608|nr:M56 family metallopeptidase [uncultured Subdoligranulum sp.]
MRDVVLHFLLLSLWGGAAALGALAVSAVLRRAHTPSRLLCWLWLAVGLRFAVPWGIPLTLPRPQNQQLAQAADTVQALAEGPAPAPLPAVQAPAVTAAQAAAPWYTQLTVWHLLAAVWAVGVLVLAVRALWGYRRLARTVATACKTADGCYSGACVPAPFTLGILRPRIYLPEGLDGETRHAVLLHEQTHLRRHDPQVKPLFYAVVCLHWFNPLAWLAFRQLEREMESACDEAAVRNCDAAARNAYCESILQYALQGRMAPGSLAFGQGSVKTRIVHLLHYRKIGAGALVVCAAAVGLSVTACMMQPQVEEATPETAETTQAEPAPQPTATPENAVTFTANTAGLPNLDDPENSPRFLCPVEYTYISRYMGGGHRGDDLSAEKGTPVYAAQDGVVTYADFHYSYGYCVILDHGTGLDGNRWSTLYAHMDDYAIANGQVVKAGELIGHVGSTGTATGNHLHFEVFLNGGVTQPCYLTAYREEDTQPLTAEMAQELLAQAAENQSSSEDILPLESQTLTATRASLQDQLDRLKEQRDQLQTSLDEMGQQFPGTEEERQQLRDNMEDNIQVTEEQIQMVEDTLALVETEIQAQKDAMITRQSELQQQIDAAQASDDAALAAQAEAARQQLDAAADQLDEYLNNGN